MRRSVQPTSETQPQRVSDEILRLQSNPPSIGFDQISNGTIRKAAI
jgi:hypothetical protein